ncbi:hypothetical protein Tcan_18143 [Toxocara canis]|uniref:Uncharacterized protein n=1 Tax=Toxocara canis TaxID=6265 RepID=A0A0B2VNM8_TOXCA|nr:hypothetical protein Tcan_18143 [Toxocara canis]
MKAAVAKKCLQKIKIHILDGSVAPANLCRVRFPAIRSIGSDQLRTNPKFKPAFEGADFATISKQYKDDPAFYDDANPGVVIDHAPIRAAAPLQMPIKRLLTI